VRDIITWELLTNYLSSSKFCVEHQTYGSKKGNSKRNFFFDPLQIVLFNNCLPMKPIPNTCRDKKKTIPQVIEMLKGQKDAS